MVKGYPGIYKEADATASGAVSGVIDALVKLLEHRLVTFTLKTVVEVPVQTPSDLIRPISMVRPST